MEQVIISGYHDLLNNAVVGYSSLEGGGVAWGPAPEDIRQQIISTPGKLKNLRFKLNAAPGVGTSYTFTLRVNGADTALTVTISGTDTQGSDTVNEVAVVAGDNVALQCTPAGTPTARYSTWTLMFEGDRPRESLILGGYATKVSGVSINYNFCAGGFIWSTTEDCRPQIVSTSGKIKNLHIYLDGAPGAGRSYTFTLRVNGADTALTVTISGAATTGSDLVNEVAVNPGDRITLKCTPADAPTTRRAKWGMTFVADTDGESLILGGSDYDLDNTNTKYNELNAVGSHIWVVTESDRYQPGQVCVLKNLYMYLNGAPGAGTSYTFTLRRNAANTALACTVSGANTTCNDTVNEIPINNFDDLALQVVPAGTPAIRDAAWGMTVYIAPPPVPGNPLINKPMIRLAKIKRPKIRR